MRLGSNCVSVFEPEPTGAYRTKDPVHSALLQLHVPHEPPPAAGAPPWLPSLAQQALRALPHFTGHAGPTYHRAARLVAAPSLAEAEAHWARALPLVVRPQALQYEQQLAAARPQEGVVAAAAAAAARPGGPARGAAGPRGLSAAPAAATPAAQGSCSSAPGTAAPTTAQRQGRSGREGHGSAPRHVRPPLLGSPDPAQLACLAQLCSAGQLAWLKDWRLSGGRARAYWAPAKEARVQ